MAVLQTLPATREGAHADPNPPPPPANPSVEPSIARLWKTASLETPPYFLGDSELPDGDLLMLIPCDVSPGCSTSFWCGTDAAHPPPQHCWHPARQARAPPAPLANWLPANPHAFLAALPAFPTSVPLRWSEATELVPTAELDTEVSAGPVLGPCANPAGAAGQAAAALAPHRGVKRPDRGFQRDVCHRGEGSDGQSEKKRPFPLPVSLLEPSLLHPLLNSRDCKGGGWVRPAGI